MKKRVISIVLIAVMALSLVSCKSGAGEAKKAVDGFMTALGTYDLAAMSKYVEDFPDNTGTAYKYDIYTDDHYAYLYEAANASMSYTVGSASADKVTVKVTMPDVYSLYQSVFMSVLSQAMSDKDKMDFILNDENDPQLMIIALMIDQIKNNGIDTVEKEITLSIGKINGEYKIMNNDQLEILMSDQLSLAQRDVVSAVDEETETSEG